MTTVIRDYPATKGKMSVAPVQWMPGCLSAMLPFFAVPEPNSGKLCLRADDPNIYGVNYNSLLVTPVVTKSGVTKPSNKGCNFYSAPWCIPTFPSRDLGRRVRISEIDTAVTDYITALYGLIGVTPITLTNWRLEEEGYAKAYQVIQGSSYVNVSGKTYFGAAALPNTQIAGVGETTLVNSPLITCDFIFNGSPIQTYQMSYNTFYAVDTPIVLSAIDSSSTSDNRIYFTLLNNVTVMNGPNYPA